MKKITIALALATVVLLPLACKKKEAPLDPASTTTTGGSNTGGSTTVAAGSFTWTENGGATQTADSAFWTTGTWGTGIRASKGGFTNYFEVNWATQNNTSIGSKTLASGAITFLKGSESYGNGNTETLNVTAFTTNLMSGNFTSSVSGGTITTIVAGFTSIKQK